MNSINEITNSVKEENCVNFDLYFSRITNNISELLLPNQIQNTKHNMLTQYKQQKKHNEIQTTNKMDLNNQKMKKASTIPRARSHIP